MAISPANANTAPYGTDSPKHPTTPTVDIQETPKEEISPTNCGICLEEILDQKDSIASLPCLQEHSYHLSCLQKWLQANTTCPLCKRTIEKDERSNIPDIPKQILPLPPPLDSNPPPSQRPPVRRRVIENTTQNRRGPESKIDTVCSCIFCVLSYCCLGRPPPRN